MKKGAARWVLLTTLQTQKTAAAPKKPDDRTRLTQRASASCAPTGTSGMQNASGNSDDGPSKQQLNRTNAYGDGYFGGPVKARPMDPSKNHGASRFPVCGPIPGPNGETIQWSGRWHGNGTDVQTRDCARLNHSREAAEGQRSLFSPTRGHSIGQMGRDDTKISGPRKRDGVGFQRGRTDWETTKPPGRA
jgi:hypothetical protein